MLRYFGNLLNKITPSIKPFLTKKQTKMQTTMNDLNAITNNNGGGMSVDVTGKYTSVRHAKAKLQGKLTAGEAAAWLSKYLKKKVSAKEIQPHFTEWHHSGFYKNASGKSTMGRTWFITPEDLQDLADSWDKKQGNLINKATAALMEVERKKTRYYSDFTFIGIVIIPVVMAKKRNFKRLAWFNGNELQKPANFTPITEEFYNTHKEVKKSYYGWEEPKISDF